MGMQQRRTTRHRVEIPCELVTSNRDEPELYWATDLSGHGLWLEGAQSLPLGEVVVACVTPGVWWRRREIQVFAEVVRVSYGLRQGDSGPGAGLRFLDLSPAERWALRRWLRPRPIIDATRRFPVAPKRAMPVTRATFASPFSTRVC